MFKIKDAWQIVENTQGVQIYTDTRDGQQYRYKQFGTQIWMIDNWNYGGLPGDYVQLGANQSAGHASRYKDVDDYQNWESEYGLKRGALYTVFDAGIQYVSPPEGWRIPTESDWNTLISWAATEYPGFGLQALMAKTTFWCPNNPSSSVIYDNYNKSGFDLVPAGYCYGSSHTCLYSDSSTNCAFYQYLGRVSGSRQYFRILQNENETPSYGKIYISGTPQYCSVRLIKDGGAPDPQPIITDIVTTLDATGSDNKLATEKATRSAITSAVSSKMSNPMTTAGDIIVGGTSGAPSRLGVGTSGQVLKVGTNGLEWATDSAGMTNPMTTAGDIIVGGTSGEPSRLGVGSSGQVLKVGANGIEWGAETGQALYLGAFDSRNRPQDATTGQFILDTDLGYILYRYGSAWINSTGTVYEGSVTPSTDTPVRWMENPMTSEGDLIIGGASGTPGTLAIGTEGQVLTVSSGVPTWATGGGGGGGSTFQASGTPYGLKVIGAGSDDNYAQTRWNMFFPEIDKIRSVRLLMPGSIKRPNKFDCGIYMGTNYNSCALISSLTRSSQTWSGSDWQKFVFDADVDVSDKSKLYWVAFTTSKNQSTNIAYAVTMENSYADKNLQGLVTTNYAEMPASLPLGTGSLGIGLAFALDANP